jgi:MFS family permease
LNPARQSIGPIVLAEGVSRRHVSCYLFAALISIGMFTYLVALTPYILTVNLGLPESEHGQISGDLVFWQEILLLSVLGWWGAVSDRYGRRPIYVLGFAVLAIAYASYAFATTVTELIVFRLVFGVGVAAATTSLAAVLADYPANESRGKLTGVAFLLNGLGALVFFVGLTQLPEFFSKAGVDDVWAARYSYLVAAGIALIAAIVMLGLKPGRPPEVSGRTPILKLMAEGMQAGRRPRIALSYLSAFAARADMAIVSLFLTLWVVQAATATGMTAAEATSQAGQTVGVAIIASLIWSPVFGAIGDRIDRLSLLVIAFAIGTLGYGWVASLDNILGLGAIPALVCLGMGLGSCQLASTVVLAEEAPVKLRGSAFGTQAFCGALGILAISFFGGRLFDAVGPYSPFVAVALSNAVVFAWSAAYRARELRNGEAAA